MLAETLLRGLIRKLRRGFFSPDVPRQAYGRVRSLTASFYQPQLAFYAQRGERPPPSGAFVDLFVCAADVWGRTVVKFYPDIVTVQRYYTITNLFGLETKLLPCAAPDLLNSILSTSSDRSALPSLSDQQSLCEQALQTRTFFRGRIRNVGTDSIQTTIVPTQRHAVDNQPENHNPDVCRCQRRGRSAKRARLDHDLLDALRGNACQLRTTCVLNKRTLL